MVVTLGQQYNVREKPTVILYAYINRHAERHQKDSKNKQNQCSTPSNMVVVIIYYCVGCKYEVKWLHGI